MRGCSVARRWLILAIGVSGAMALAGCNLGVKPVTYELVDPSQADLPLSPNGSATGDIDLDGDEDVVVTGRNGYAVLTNDGSGLYSIAFPVSYEGMSRPSLIDVDGDSDLDLVVGLSVWRNDGTGTFAPPELTTTAASLSAVVPSDVDRDGDADILGTSIINQERHVSVYLNDGTGVFGPPTAYPLAFKSDTFTIPNLAVGDLDNDGNDDVVVTDAGDYTQPDGEVVDGTVAMVGLNDGNGGFIARSDPIQVTYNADSRTDSLTPALADLDADGDLDVCLGGPASVITLLSRGDGSLAPPQVNRIPSTFVIDRVAAADIDEDGNIDVVGYDDIWAPTPSGVIAYGDGTGGIAESHEVSTGASRGGDGASAIEIDVTDLEGDSDADLLFLANNLGVLENASEGSRPEH